MVGAYSGCVCIDPSINSGLPKHVGRVRIETGAKQMFMINSKKWGLFTKDTLETLLGKVCCTYKPVQGESG